jgi:hypothetical protein
MSRRRQLVAIAVGFVVCCVIIGGVRVKLKGGYEQDLARILGAQASGWLEHTAVMVWQPDPNRKPFTYYVKRTIDEPGFRRLAVAATLSIEPSAAAREAVWELPAGARFDGWGAPTVPAGTGLDARGKIGRATVYARWHDQSLWFVVMPDEE